MDLGVGLAGLLSQSFTGGVLSILCLPRRTWIHIKTAYKLMPREDIAGRQAPPKSSWHARPRKMTQAHCAHHFLFFACPFVAKVSGSWGPRDWKWPKRASMMFPRKFTGSPGAVVRIRSVRGRRHPLHGLGRTEKVHVVPQSQDVDQDLVGHVPWVRRLLVLVCWQPDVAIMRPPQEIWSLTTFSLGIQTPQRFSHPDTKTLAKMLCAVQVLSLIHI